MDSKTADPNNFDSQGKPLASSQLKAMARLSVMAGSESVGDLARRVFGPTVILEPPSGVAVVRGEPIMYVSTRAPYTQQQFKYFNDALDADGDKYKVNYCIPDTEYSPNTIKVFFFKGYTPIR